MGKIENYVNFEQLNKCFTNSMCLASELYDIDDVSNTLCNASIKYENSISLMQIAKDYNDAYVAFLNDFNNIKEKINLGKEMSFVRYFEDNKNDIVNGRYLELFIYENNFVKNYPASLMFYISQEKDGKCNCKADNSHFMHYWDKEYRTFLPQISEDILKEYLDVFQKHQNFLKMYNDMRFNQIHSGCHLLYIDNDAHFNLTSGLKKLVIWGHDERCDGSFHYDFVFNIGNNFSVNYEASTFHNDEGPVEFSNEDVDKFLNTVIINKEFTRKKLR